MRVDENTKEVLKTWPLTTVRRWAASPNSFTLVGGSEGGMGGGGGRRKREKKGRGRRGEGGRKNARNAGGMFNERGFPSAFTPTPHERLYIPLLPSLSSPPSLPLPL